MFCAYNNMHGNAIKELIKDAFIPRMVPIRQNFPRPRVSNVPSRVRELLFTRDISDTIMPGMEIAITCGSRGIANIKYIIREICTYIVQKGAKPFIVPAMGSHGGMTAEGQRAIIEGYGVTEEFCGAPIRSCMDVKRIGTTEDGRDVFIDSNAANANGIIVVGRIKPHTDFRGPYESGMMKMMVVGLGKHRGAELFHMNGPRHMAENLLIFGKAILYHSPILFGLAVLENAYDETARIEIMKKDEFIDREPPLLKEARDLMARCYIEEVELLIVDRIGKDISGDGMDPNIVGRFSNPWVSGGIHATKVAILDLTDESKGQMVGLGYGDVTTRRCLNKCDFSASLPNALISTAFTPFRIPIVFETDKDAISACLKYCGENNKMNPRVIRIRDTKHMDLIWVSEALLDEVSQHPQLEICGKPENLPFDAEGNLW